MFGSMKKALVVAAVAGLGAVAPSIASADTWRANGAVVGGAPGVAVAGGGALRFTVPVGGGATATTECDVDVTANLFNPTGGTGAGSVSGFAVPAPLSCAVTSSPAGAIGACRVTNVVSTASTTPWAISTLATNGTITGVNFTNTYGTVPGGATCALAGSKVVAGNVTGAWTNPGTLTFSSATGLTVNPGSLPATVNGSVFLEGTAGQTITLQ